MNSKLRDILEEISQKQCELGNNDPVYIELVELRQKIKEWSQS